MTGIVSSDFELLLKKNNSNINELNDNLINLKKSYCTLMDNFQNGELSFFVDKMKIELNQLNKVSSKIEGYQSSLTNVYKGYQEQYAKIVSDSKKLIS